MLGSSKAANVACLAIFDPKTNNALSRHLEIESFVLKSGFACEWLIYAIVTAYSIFGIRGSRAACATAVVCNQTCFSRFDNTKL